MTPLRLGLLQYPVERPASLADWAAKLHHWLAQATPHADMVVLPEYACVELAPALAGGPTDEAGELAAMVAAAEQVLATLRAAARQHGLWLLGGSLPMASQGRILNRAPFVAPDGTLAFQDKQQMTRFESERWGISGGAGPQVFDTPWGRLGISICYDVEFPKHVRAQVEAGAWLILTPACTDSAQGFNRVRFSAQARALENQCFVAVAPTVGLAPWCAALDENHGLAAVYGPVDRGFPEDGILAAGSMDAAQWLFCTLEQSRIEAVRRDGAVLHHRDWPRAPVAQPQPASFA